MTSPTWRITLRDLWKWWKVRKLQLRALLILGLILTWMSLAPWQAERRSHAVVRELPQTLHKQEATRHSHFARLLGTEDARRSRQNRDTAARRKKLAHLERMISQLSLTVEKRRHLE